MPRKKPKPKQRSNLEVIQHWAKEPSEFVNEVLDGLQNPRWSKQTELIEAVRDNREVYAKSAFGCGKTYSAADVAVWFLHCFKPAKVITTCTSWPQVELLLWSEIRERRAWNQENAPLAFGGTCLNTEWWYNDQHFALGLSPALDAGKPAMRFQGFHSPNTLVIFDEAAGVDAKLWDAKDALMTGANPHFLAISNAISSNDPFASAWKKGAGKRITMGTFESPNFTAHGITTLEKLEALSEEDAGRMVLPYPALVDPLWAVRMLKKWGKTSAYFMSRVLAEFPESSEDDLIPLSWLESCKGASPAASGNAVLGVDVARFGDAENVFIGFREKRQFYKHKTRKEPLTETAGRIIKLIKEHRFSTVVIDETGVGGGVVDIVREWASATRTQCAIMGFSGADKPKDAERFINLRANAWWSAREMIQERDVQLEDRDDLFHQLTTIKYFWTTRGKIQVESKEDMQKRGLPSPDEADAAVMAMWVMRYQTKADNSKKLKQIRAGRPMEGASTPWGEWS